MRIIDCPKCKQKLRLNLTESQRIKCPACFVIFTITVKNNNKSGDSTLASATPQRPEGSLRRGPLIPAKPQSPDPTLSKSPISPVADSRKSTSQNSTPQNSSTLGGDSTLHQKLKEDAKSLPKGETNSPPPIPVIPSPFWSNLDTGSDQPMEPTSRAIPSDLSKQTQKSTQNLNPKISQNQPLVQNQSSSDIPGKKETYLASPHVSEEMLFIDANMQYPSSSLQDLENHSNRDVEDFELSTLPNVSANVGNSILANSSEANNKSEKQLDHSKGLEVESRKNEIAFPGGSIASRTAEPLQASNKTSEMRAPGSDNKLVNDIPLKSTIPSTDFVVDNAIILDFEPSAIPGGLIVDSREVSISQSQQRSEVVPNPMLAGSPEPTILNKDQDVFLPDLISLDEITPTYPITPTKSEVHNNPPSKVVPKIGMEEVEEVEDEGFEVVDEEVESVPAKRIKLKPIFGNRSLEKLLSDFQNRGSRVFESSTNDRSRDSGRGNRSSERDDRDRDNSRDRSRDSGRGGRSPERDDRERDDPRDRSRDGDRVGRSSQRGDREREDPRDRSRDSGRGGRSPERDERTRDNSRDRSRDSGRGNRSSQREDRDRDEDPDQEQNKNQIRNGGEGNLRSENQKKIQKEEERRTPTSKVSQTNQYRDEFDDDPKEDDNRLQTKNRNQVVESNDSKSNPITYLRW